MTSTQERIENDLRGLFREAVGPDRYCSVRELVAAGIPRSPAETLSRETRRIASRDDADQLAAEWAPRLDVQIERSVDPAKLAASVPRT